LRLVSTGQFKKDCKRQMKRGKNIKKLRPIIQALANQEPIKKKYRDHSLSGTWANRRECHIEGDWLLIYCVKGDDLILERTGSHSDLFK